MPVLPHEYTFEDDDDEFPIDMIAGMFVAEPERVVPPRKIRGFGGFTTVRVCAAALAQATRATLTAQCWQSDQQLCMEIAGHKTKRKPFAGDKSAKE